MIIIVASQIDPHVDSVVEHLHRKGFSDFLRIDLGQVHSTHQVDFGPSAGESRIRDVHSGRTVCLSDVSAVWWRRVESTREAPFEVDASADVADINEAAINSRSIIESIDEERFPFGHPYRMREGENKFRQLQVAASVGLSTPPYRFSTSTAHLVQFARDVPSQLVIKPIGVRSIVSPEGSRGLYVKAVSPVEFIDTVDRRSTSLFLQQRIERQHDVRAFIGRDFCFAVEISVKGLPAGETDWRPYTLTCDHQPTLLPAEVLGRARDFLKRMKLPAAHFDFIVDREGNFFFLEANPGGQWLWLHYKTGLPIPEFMANRLIEAHVQRQGTSSVSRVGSLSALQAVELCLDA